jgi:hypothetical protein
MKALRSPPILKINHNLEGIGNDQALTTSRNQLPESVGRYLTISLKARLRFK